jgi:dTDP-4-dehydrorhamnose reductase
VNAGGAGNVAEAATRCGARLIQISTDYVFDGNRSTPYPPEAPPAPVNVYGASKLEGELRALRSAPGALVIRAGWLYSWNGKNFLLTVMRLINASKPLKVVSDQIGCPSRADELASVIWKAAKAGLEGIYHWANAGQASWYEFATEIAGVAKALRLVQDVPSITAVSSEEYRSPARRPHFSVLDSTKLGTILNYSPLHWREDLRQEIARGPRVTPL